MKSYIIETVKNFGPLKSRLLAEKINKNYISNLNYLLVFRWAKELLADSQLGAVKIGFSNLYYEKRQSLSL